MRPRNLRNLDSWELYQQQHLYQQQQSYQTASKHLRQQWESIKEMNPHGAAHYGTYVFKPTNLRLRLVAPAINFPFINHWYFESIGA